MLSSSVPAEPLEAISGRNPEIFQLLDGIDYDQLPEHDPKQIGGKPADALTPKESLGIRVGEALDHPERYPTQVITSSVITWPANA